MVFQFNIDKVTHQYIPKNQVPKLPKLLSHFLGNNENNKKQRPDYLIWLEILIGTFSGLLLLEGVFRSPNVFTTHHHAPIIIASYGATAILCFNANFVPLAQPRNIVVGTFVSTVISICILKLFSLSEAGRDHYYVGGALSVGIASVAMLILNCVHPPAGASALIPFVDEQVRQMSWWYIPMQLVSSVLITCVALITGNILRKYPVFWWTPMNKSAPEPLASKEKVPDPPAQIVISADKLEIPDHLHVEEIDLEYLETLQKRLLTRSSHDIV